MFSKIKKYILHPSFILLKLDSCRLITLDDKKFLKISYKKNIGKKLNLERPTSFNEKLQWLKIYDRNPKYTQLVDKNAVKKIVADKIGNQYVIPTLGVYRTFDDIDFSLLPDCFVMKCTHDSGSSIVCKNKNALDKKAAKRVLNKALKRNFYYFGREWPYKNVCPSIIVEQYMNDNEHDDLLDYKFMCFNGKVKCSFVCSDRRSERGLAVDFYDREWKHMPFQRHYRNVGYEIEKPRNYELMVRLAEKLSRNIPFVRVDFYEIEGRVYFGELTFFPGNGMEEFTPERYDRVLGDMLDISNVGISDA